MRRLSLLLIALLCVIGATFPLAKAAYAAGTTCFFSDNEGTIYDDGYASAGPYQVGLPGNWKQAMTDLKVWRYTDPGNHWCYRGYYTSAWTTNQSFADINDSLRVWACGQFAGQATSSTNGNDWRAFRTSVNWNGAMGSVRDMWVNDVWPNGGTVEFYAYGTAPCGRQGDNFYSSVCHYDWAVCLGPVVNGGQGYLNEGNL